jgi:hypothetical protein
MRGRLTDTGKSYSFRAGTFMSLFGFISRRLALCLLCMVTGVCVAQTSQFLNQPKLLQTFGRVTGFLTGAFQSPAGGVDILFINAPAVSGTTSSVLAGTALSSPGTVPQPRDIISFTNATNVAAALGDFDGDHNTDFAFAISGPNVSSNNLCVYYGTGYIVSYLESHPGFSSYSGGNIYPAQGESGCMTLPTTPQVAKPPIFSYIAALPFKTGVLISQLLVEDSANNLLYVISNNGNTGGNNGTLPGFKLVHAYLLADGAGPIYTGDFNNDGKMDFIVNGQTNYTATVYLGDGNGGFTPQTPYTFGGKIYSMLMQDMDGDGIVDMVVERDKGVIEIHKGNGDGTFAVASKGGTLPGLDGTTGNGGHLALIDPNTLNILTTTPIGLSVLKPTPSGSLNYQLQGIYNIGPGRSATPVLANILDSNVHPDLAVDSPEGIAILYGDTNGDGGFQTSLAYPTLAPALDAAVGDFQNLQSNKLDILVATGATQAQLLTGKGDGTFNPATATNASGGPSGVPAGLWSRILQGDFNGDGKLDIAYSLTGLPLPTTGPGLYVQYGNGDGTFQAPVAVAPAGASNSNTFYGGSAVGDFNGDGNTDIANVDANYLDTLLGQKAGGFILGMNLAASNGSLSPVAAGFFKTGRINKQDLIVQQGTSLIPYLNGGDGKNFTAKPALSGTPTAASGLIASAILLTDVDGDNNDDVVALYHNLASDPSNPSASTPNQLYLWYGIGDGTFTAPVITQLSRNYYLAAVADMNSDGAPDLVLGDGYLVDILYNQDNRAAQFVSDCGSFGTTTTTPCNKEQQFLAGQGINAIVPQNVRGGGAPDLVVANGGPTISNPIVLGGVAQSSAKLATNPDVSTGGVTVLLSGNSSTQTGNQPTMGTVTASPEPSSYGATFTITAVVSPASGTIVPQGTVTFSIDGNPAGCSPDALQSTYAPSGSPAGSAGAICVVPAGNILSSTTHTLIAAYSGNSFYEPNTFNGTHTILASTTTTLYMCIGGMTANCPATGTVTPVTPYPTSLTMTYGQIWNGIAAVSTSDNTIPLGNIAISDAYNGGTASVLCMLLASTPGACPASVGSTQGTAVGINVITATYLPGTADTTHTGSSSTPVTITVNQDTGTKATVIGAPSTAAVGQPVTFTATVSGSYAPPTGTVTFLNGTTVLGTQTLTPSATGVTSTATLTTSSLPVGVDSITVSYAATTDFVAATSSVFQETITLATTADFTVAVTPTPVSIGVGYGTLLTVTVTPLAGFTEGVNLTCANLPSDATCTFTQAAIAGGGGSSTLSLQTTAPHSCGTTQPYFLGANGGGPGIAPFALPALAGLLAIFIPGRRRWLRALAVALLAAGATQITGCSTCTDLGTKPGTYTFQVTGTSAVTGEVASQAVALSVTI